MIALITPLKITPSIMAATDRASLVDFLFSLQNHAETLFFFSYF